MKSKKGKQKVMGKVSSGKRVEKAGREKWDKNKHKPTML